MWDLFRVSVCAVLCAAMPVVFGGCALGRESAPPRSEAAATPPDAGDVLRGMTTFLAAAERFSVRVESSYDVVQDSGQQIEFGESRQIIVDRPDRLRVDVEQSDGDRHFVVYDGANLTAYSLTRNVYATAAVTGGVDTAVKYFVKELQMKMPLAVLLTSGLREELERRTRSLDYVERTRLLGVPAHHVAGRADTVDYQFWVAEGAEPVPLRVVLTYKDAEGQPQYRASFHDWDFAPKTRESQFAFTPPEGAQKIAFLAQLSRAGEQKAPAATGEQP
jgi:hypothetical protein